MIHSSKVTAAMHSAPSLPALLTMGFTGYAVISSAGNPLQPSCAYDWRGESAGRRCRCELSAARNCSFMVRPKYGTN